jgi:hypothetical protein
VEHDMTSQKRSWPHVHIWMAGQPSSLGIGAQSNSQYDSWVLILYVLIYCFKRLDLYLRVQSEMYMDLDLMFNWNPRLVRSDPKTY